MKQKFIVIKTIGDDNSKHIAVNALYRRYPILLTFQSTRVREGLNVPAYIHTYPHYPVVEVHLPVIIQMYTR